METVCHNFIPREMKSPVIFPVILRRNDLAADLMLLKISLFSKCLSACNLSHIGIETHFTVYTEIIFILSGIDAVNCQKAYFSDSFILRHVKRTFRSRLSLSVK